LGLSVSASAAILFVAFLICFGSLFGAATKYYATVDEILEESRENALAVQKISLEFTDIDEASGSFALKNTGSATLLLSDFEVLVNGTLVLPQELSINIIGHPGSDLILPGDVALFDLDEPIWGCRIVVFTTMGISMTHVPTG